MSILNVNVSPLDEWCQKYWMSGSTDPYQLLSGVEQKGFEDSVNQMQKWFEDSVHHCELILRNLLSSTMHYLR